MHAPAAVLDAASGLLRPFSGANWDLLADDWELAGDAP